jgi:PTS system nitrogen regulatory IIA component
MTIGDLLDRRAIAPRVTATTKRQALAVIAEVAARTLDIDAAEALDALMARETVGSTGVGRGVAIPHARVPGLRAVHAVAARLEKPIDFDAMDGEPVDLLVALFAPPEAGSEHLRALARVSRLLRQDDVRQQLRAAQSADAIMALLVRDSTPSAAA